MDRNDDDDVVAAREGAYVDALVERQVGERVEVGVPRRSASRVVSVKKLGRRAIGRGAGTQRRERGRARVEVDGSAIVGVDQRPVLELVALVHVGNTRAHGPQHGLPDDDARRDLVDPFHERHEAREETGVVHEQPRRVDHVAFPHDVGIDPRRVALRLAQRLLEVAAEPVGRDGPDADERLEYEPFLERVGRGRAAHVGDDRSGGGDLVAPLGERSR